MPGLSIYIHIPFCKHRCGYCDFNTYAGIQTLIPAYIQAICNEIIFLGTNYDGKLIVDTIYFGGGTPSLLKSQEIRKMLNTIQRHFQISSSPEISLEANPGTVSKIYLQRLLSIGINRLSLGMQSANQSELKLLDRHHKVLDTINAVKWSREIGFTNINLDLIFGLPNQEFSNWKDNLAAAIALEPDHLSLYSLTIEEGTPLYDRIRSGFLPEPDPDLAADMYEYASDYLVQNGYHQYEISNWTKIGENNELSECKHNLQYWRNLPYLGIGAGAHGYINNLRTVNVFSPNEYISRLKNTKLYATADYSFPLTPATETALKISKEAEIGETMMTGLRLVFNGVSNREFQARFGFSLMDRYSKQIKKFISIGLLEWTGKETDGLRLTTKGRLLGNQVFCEFI